MIPEQDIKIVEAMERYGGSFVKSLAACLHRADHINYRKLKDAFSDYFLHYENFIKNPDLND